MFRPHGSLIAFGLAACAAPQPADEEPSITQRTWSGSVLYARDGSVVSPAPAEERGAAPSGGVRPSEGGRMYILELYQKAIEERDALAAEVSALGAELEAARAKLGERDGALARAEARIAEIEGRERALADENLELAARVTTAQIRRLQAEKLLLESKLELRRSARDSAPVEAGQGGK